MLLQRQFDATLAFGLQGQPAQQLMALTVIYPLVALQGKMVTVFPGGQPDLMQRLLPVNDKLDAVLKGQVHDAAHGFTFNVFTAFINTCLNMLINGIRQSMKFTVVHCPLPIAFENVNAIIRALNHIHSHTMNKFKLTALVALVLGLSACGLKGPLTLPETEQQPTQVEQS